MIKIFLVEDEIVTREGMRDTVDWRGLGCELVGEAADGELALPLIRERRPDVIITDIKMPFMDGLELTRLVKTTAPNTKVVILSGHDEFQFAQQAIALGVTEYLLKPVSLRELAEVLRKLAAQIDAERDQRRRLEGLAEQAENSLALQREKFLAQLALGGGSSAEAIRRSQELGIDLSAAYYLVVVALATKRCEDAAGAGLLYEDAEFVETLVRRLEQAAERMVWFRKDVDEFVLLLQGNDGDALLRQAAWIEELAGEEARRHTGCELAIGTGVLCERLSGIAASYKAAVAAARRAPGGGGAGETAAAGGLPAFAMDLLLNNRRAVERYLRQGSAGDFESFFAALSAPLLEATPADRPAMNYLLIDLALAAAGFVSELGGEPAEVVPQAVHIGARLREIGEMAGGQALASEILLGALAFRDRRAAQAHAMALQRARELIAQRFTDSELSLTDVAAHAHMSSSHFSVVFKRETGLAFSEYLTGLRIERAKELLRGSGLRMHEIAQQVGYSDPHYFSAAFKRVTGQTPREWKGHG